MGAEFYHRWEEEVGGGIEQDDWMAESIWMSFNDKRLSWFLRRAKLFETTTIPEQQRGTCASNATATYFFWSHTSFVIMFLFLSSFVYGNQNKQLKFWYGLESIFSKKAHSKRAHDSSQQHQLRTYLKGRIIITFRNKDNAVYVASESKIEEARIFVRWERQSAQYPSKCLR